MLKYILDTDMVIYTMKSRTCGLMIAGHVRSLGGIFVADNTGEFARVDGLRRITGRGTGIKVPDH